MISGNDVHPLPGATNGTRVPACRTWTQPNVAVLAPSGLPSIASDFAMEGGASHV